MPAPEHDTTPRPQVNEGEGGQARTAEFAAGELEARVRALADELADYAWRDDRNVQVLNLSAAQGRLIELARSLTPAADATEGTA